MIPRRRPPRGVRRRTAFTDLDCEYLEHSEERSDEEGYGYGGYDPISNPSDSIHPENDNSFQEISFRGMIQVLKQSRNHPADLVMAMDCSGNSHTALQNQQVREALYPAVEKVITSAHNVRRFGLYVTGASELVFPLQSLVWNDDSQQHLLSQWRELRDSNVSPLSSVALAVDIVGVGRFIAVKTWSFQNRTDLYRLIVSNWSSGQADMDSLPISTEATLSEVSIQKSHVSLDDESLDESKYDLVQDDHEDVESWRDVGSDDWEDHDSVQESWDAVSDVDSVMSLDDRQELYSYADIVRFGVKPSSKESPNALQYLSVPDLGSKTPSTRNPLPSIIEDSVSFMANDPDLRQQFVDLQVSIDLLLDHGVEPPALIDAKYERRGRRGGARSDGTIRWKRFK
jgi:hypothetical protein